MLTCPSCGHALHKQAIQCPACGEAVSPSLVRTNDNRQVLDSNSPTSGDIAIQELACEAEQYCPEIERFIPGTIVAERYRIVSLIGRGGMGEVYRADDLRLRNPVALKFLSSETTQQEILQELFLQEVRIARQITHPNVCRVYDINEHEGHHFISMQYVDGENLQSLLKRIGRFPSEKALDITQQLCSGLAAIHDRSVLLRDLKPSNIMIDGRGKVLITDFGLASLAQNIKGSDRIIGTPAYMAPEQLIGAEASIKTDIYALGQILYEIYTGQSAFDVRNLEDLIKKKTEKHFELPRSIVRDLDPEIEEIIVRCLERDPERRPESVRKVMASFPGLDPLKAALAAGETPSPEVLVAAKDERQVTQRQGMALMVVLLVLMGLAFYLSMKTKVTEYLPIQKNPLILAENSEEFISRVLPGIPVKDRASGYRFNRAIVSALRENPNRDSIGASSSDMSEMMLFWYRSSPSPLLSTMSRVSEIDPPLTEPGMTAVVMTPTGRLLQYLSVPSYVQVDKNATDPDWHSFFTEAGLTMSDFTPAEPFSVPRKYCDKLVAWKGPHPTQENVDVIVEGGSLSGTPVHFSVLAPWTVDFLGESPENKDLDAFSSSVKIFMFTIIIWVIFAAVVLARQNLKQGRGDRRGTFRLSLAVFLFSMIGWLFAAHHVPDFDELALFREGFGQAAFYAILIALLYLALEPHARRIWPHQLISWNRVLTGRFKDPLVGRDILVGVILGISWMCYEMSEVIVQIYLGYGPPMHSWVDINHFMSSGSIIGLVMDIFNRSIFESLVLLVLLLVLCLIFKRKWLALLFYVILFFAFGMVVTRAGNSPLHWLFSTLNSLFILVILIRFGLLTLIVTYLFDLTYLFFPITVHVDTWYGITSIGVVLVTLAVATFGLMSSLAGQPFLKDDMFNVS